MLFFMDYTRTVIINYMRDLVIFQSIKYFHLEVNKITNEKNLKMFVTLL